MTTRDLDTLRRENARLKITETRLRQWISDLTSGMYVNCVYCGHRYGPSENTPVSLADVLKEHVQQCPEHPLSIALRALETAVDEIHRLNGNADYPSRVLNWIRSEPVGSQAPLLNPPVPQS